MNLLNQFKSFINQSLLFQNNDRLLLAVSGGVDSVVLCELCFQSGFYFEIAHCNFQLRGKESDADENMVKSLAEKYKVKYHGIKFDTEKYAEENKTNIQIAARALRYKWFNEIIEQEKINAIKGILTAHHADDNVETLLMNFFKGTGIKGLQGMAVKDGGIGGRINRPLLFASKEQIIAFATQHNLSWREDVSNASNKYTRNYFRNELLPAIGKVFPQVEINLNENIERFKDAAILFDLSIEQLKKKLLVKKGVEWHLPVLKLKKTPAVKTVLYEILKHFDFTSHQVNDALQLLDADSGKYISSTTHRLIKNRKWVIISPLENNEVSTYIIEAADKEIYFSSQSMRFKKVLPPVIFENNNSLALIDEKMISFPLILRKWKKGDYFYPLGMDKKKKLSRFFIDIKLSLTEKENIWVLESDKKIIWIVGHRIDNRVKVTPATTEIFSITLVSSK
ncbi:MAG: tRNA lysidine(34) synthetase TilS [Bacteroidota bacterium]